MYDAINGLQFLIADHLGSVVAVTDDTGTLVSSSQQRYLPFGGELLEADSPTDFGYTGQRSNTGVIDDFDQLGLAAFNKNPKDPEEDWATYLSLGYYLGGPPTPYGILVTAMKLK